MQLLAGTSGFAYKEWKGSFYPRELPDAAMLRYYAERFRTVEINNTFYRMPTEPLLARWSGEVSDRFAFVLKAPRRITHEKRLKGTGDDVAQLMRVAAVLGARLGPILFQLPPFARIDAPCLRDFLAALPPGTSAAFEFRHPSWFDDAVYQALRDAGAVLCVADTDEEGATPLVATASWGYLRLRRQGYDDPQLRAWAERVGAQPWERAFVFFKHEDAGTGPKLASRFLELAA
ncbi:MAG TPA: DUF72 domain-containing protein [Candidatus Polarisedimenticolaceae bacterium]|nr:DUF72 domain-containing protein [Candidatus Polarisedimenticolaceae bacterium]